MDNEIVVVSGLSAVGKDTLCDMLVEHGGYNFIISHTTRPMRPNESDGVPYRFINKEEFDNINMIEVRSYNTLVDNIPDTWYYGVAETAVDDDKKYVVVLDLQGTEEFIEHFGDRIIPIYLYVDSEERKSRSIARGGHNEAEWNRREVDDLLIFPQDKIDDIYVAKIKSELMHLTYANAMEVIDGYK